MNIYLPHWLFVIFLYFFPFGWIGLGMWIRDIHPKDRRVIRLLGRVKLRDVKIKELNNELQRQDDMIARQKRRIAALERRLDGRA